MYGYDHALMTKKPDYFSLSAVIYGYLWRGKYDDHIRNWFKHFSPDQFLFFRAEDFYADPLRILERITDHLEIPRAVVDTSKKHLHAPGAAMSDLDKSWLVEYFRPRVEVVYDLVGITWDDFT